MKQLAITHIGQRYKVLRKVSAQIVWTIHSYFFKVSTNIDPFSESTRAFSNRSHSSTHYWNYWNLNLPHFGKISTSRCLYFDNILKIFKATSESEGTAMLIIKQILFCWSLITMSGRFAVILLSVFIVKCQRKVTDAMSVIASRQYSYKSLAVFYP